MTTLKALTIQKVEKEKTFSNIGSKEVKGINCMAWAFHATEWLLPLDIDDTEELIEEIIPLFNLRDNGKTRKSLELEIESYRYDEEYVKEICIRKMLSAFPDLRRVDNFDELGEDEYGISFSVNAEDFHFVKYENGVYSHKRGTCDVIYLADDGDEDFPVDEKVFYDCGYDSFPVRFAMKKGKVRFNEI